jgi:chromosome segregation ATPase
MPYADPEEQRAYQSRYHARYQEERREEIKARRAQWFQERKETAAVLQRVRRAVNRCQVAIDALEEGDREAALVAVTTWATSPEMPGDVVAGLWRKVSPEGRRIFVEALPARGKERKKWEWL